MKFATPTRDISLHQWHHHYVFQKKHRHTTLRFWDYFVVPEFIAEAAAFLIRGIKIKSFIYPPLSLLRIFTTPLKFSWLQEFILIISVFQPSPSLHELNLFYFHNIPVVIIIIKFGDKYTFIETVITFFSFSPVTNEF